MKISKSCYGITGLSAETPWAVNSGFVVGDHSTLIIDTGSNYLSAQTIFGYSTGIKQDNKSLVVNTEPHFDHIGNILNNGLTGRFFQRRYTFRYNQCVAQSCL